MVSFTITPAAWTASLAGGVEAMVKLARSGRCRSVRVVSLIAILIAW
jgi:hypothetical protein